jgi:hypothetical protein
MAVWYFWWQLWYIFHVLVCCAEKNLATLVVSIARRNQEKNEWERKNAKLSN